MSIGVLTYSTVFRSRLGVLNLALDASDRSFATRARIRRNIENKLKLTKIVKSDDPRWQPLLVYLVGKGFIGKLKAGRTKYKLRYAKTYPGIISIFDSNDQEVSEAAFAIADIWLSDSCVADRRLVFQPLRMQMRCSILQSRRGSSQPRREIGLSGGGLRRNSVRGILKL